MMPTRTGLWLLCLLAGCPASDEPAEDWATESDNAGVSGTAYAPIAPLFTCPN